MELEKRTVLVLGVIAAALAILGLSVFATGNADAPPPGATAVQLRGTIVVEFEGAQTAHARISQPFAVDSGASAWDAIRQSLGESKVTYQDFGGDLGILVTGFDGVTLSGNRFWAFSVNGVSSEVGVSRYIVKDADVLQFKVETF